jgi:hypothetical protein
LCQRSNEFFRSDWGATNSKRLRSTALNNTHVHAQFKQSTQELVKKDYWHNLPDYYGGKKAKINVIVIQ